MLGELVVVDGLRTVRVGRSTRAVVLAALVCRVGRPVAVEELVDLVWGDGAPPTAATMVHGAVARLRRELAGELVGTTGGGYVVDVEVDAVAFERLITVGPPAEVAQRSAAALALWRGAAYAGIGRPFARDEADRLEELRRRCVEQLADAELALGRPERAVPQLTALVTADPTRERAAAQLMRALHRLDRQADALAVYRRVRATLVAELGLEPGPALRAAEAEVLRGGAGPSSARRDTTHPAGPNDARHAAAPPTHTAGPSDTRHAAAPSPHPAGSSAARRATAPPTHSTGPSVVGRERAGAGRRARDAARLPAAISSFVGRGDDVARVTALLRDHPLTTLTGPPRSRTACRSTTSSYSVSGTTRRSPSATSPGRGRRSRRCARTSPTPSTSTTWVPRAPTASAPPTAPTTPASPP